MIDTLNWQEDNERYVGFIDILGFKEMMARKGHPKSGIVLNQVSDIIHTINKVIAKGSIYILPDNIKSVSFSDSMLFLSRSNTFEDLITLSWVMKMLQEKAIKSGIPTKGAISFGFMTADFKKSIFYGQPLIDAHLLQNEVHYYGIVLDNEAETEVKKFTSLSKDHAQLMKTYFSQLETPLKAGKVKHYNVNLHNIDGDNIDILYNTVSGHIRKYVDNTNEMLMEMNRNRTGDNQEGYILNARLFLEHVNGHFETMNETDRIRTLIEAQSVASKEVFALTIDVRGYYEKFWMGHNGEEFLKSNMASAKRGAIIKRIFIMDIDVLVNPKNEKQGHFKKIGRAHV